MPWYAITHDEITPLSAAEQTPLQRRLTRVFPPTADHEDIRNALTKWPKGAKVWTARTRKEAREIASCKRNPSGDPVGLVDGEVSAAGAYTDAPRAVQ